MAPRIAARDNKYFIALPSPRLARYVFAMKSPQRAALEAGPGRWTSLWVVALLSLIGQLCVCQFFAQDPTTHGFGETIPFSEDFNPSKLWTLAYTFPPTGTFHTVVVSSFVGVAGSDGGRGA